MKSQTQRITRLGMGLLLLASLALVGRLAQQGRQASHPESPRQVSTPSGHEKLPESATGQQIVAMPEVPQESRTEAEMSEGGMEFDRWLDAYEAAPKEQRAELEAAGVKLAMARRAEMLHWIETDPEQAIHRAIPVVRKRILPPSVRKHIEEHISSEGQLTAVVATKFSPQPEAKWMRHATIGRKTYQAYTYGRRNDHRFNNKTIPLNGIALDDKFAVNESPLRVVEPGEFEPAVLEAARKESSCPVSTEPTEDKEAAVAVLEGSKLVYLCQSGHIAAYGDELLVAALSAPPDIAYGPWSEGAKTLLYISIYYKDQTVAPVVTDMNAVNSYFLANSYNKTSITATFTPAYQMSKNAMEYTSLAEIINEARALAAANGYDYNNYTLDTIRYNGGIGDFGGVAGVGGRNNMLKTEHAGVAAHELGHNMGLWHANYWETTDGTTIGTGSNLEYGNIFDVMGNAGSFPHGHFNACEKNALNWIPTADVTAVSASGTYRMYAHDMNTFTAGNKYGITFVKDADRTYWLEYRQNAGWTNPWVMNGVTLLWDPWTNSSNGSQLLDTTPGSANGRDDALIVLGRTFSDTAAGVHFTLTARGGTSPNLWADVVVNVGSFPGNAAPSLSLAASSTTVAPNTVVNFTATASDSNGDALAYHWDFGDSTFGPNASTTSKSWATNGSKQVKCVVSDMKGGSTTQYIYVNVVNAGTYAISGTITNSGAPQSGVVVSDGTRSATTDSLGNYAILNVPNGTYTLTPSLLGTTFTPATITNVTVSGASVTGKNFTASTLAVPANGPGSGITREWWTGIAGATVADLTGNAAYSNDPTGTETVTTLFEAPINWAESYGQRMHGYFIAPTTGNYRFYIASDDNSELWLSTNATTASAIKIASVTNWTNSREWTKYASQKSAAIALTAGQRYYIRALHKEGGGGDNLAVGVEYPNGSIELPMPYHRLDPWPSVSWTAATQASANESGSLTVTAQLSSASPQNVVVPFTVSGTATGADYSIGSSPITIAAGSTTGSTTIAITPDAIHEPNGETVILTMGAPTNAALGTVRAHTATITDDDNIPPVVQAGANYAVALGSGVAWSPSQLTPQLWLDATSATINSGTVSIANAGSGGGTISGPASLTANGIGTRQTVRFSGSSQYLTGSYANTGTTLTAFFAGKSFSSTQNSWAGMMSVWQTGMGYDYNNTPSAVLFNQNGSTANSIYSYRAGALSSSTGTLTSPFLAVTVFDGSANTLYLNGTPATSVASSGNFNANNVVLGARWEGSAFTKSWNGHFGEAIVCNANLSASDRQKVEGYLAHKWSADSSLPTNHPYKPDPPMILTVNLDGTVSDPNNDTLGTTWTLVSGPAAVTIANASAVDTTATLSLAGTYIFRLTANDGYGPVTDDVAIKVNPTGLYSVVYNGNGSTGGSDPVDANFYTNGSTVTVLDNTGNLTKSGYNFSGWNTAANGSGTSRAAGNTFSIGPANVTLYAQWAPVSAYEAWFASANLGPSADASFNGDVNNDGVANGLGWLLGATGPDQNGQPFLPQPVQSSGNLLLSFKMLKSTKRGTAVLSLQYSKDLGISDPWTNHTIQIPDANGSVSGVNFVITPISGTDHNQVQATIPSSAAGTSGKVFSRLVGALPP